MASYLAKFIHLEQHPVETQMASETSLRTLGEKSKTEDRVQGARRGEGEGGGI